MAMLLATTALFSSAVPPARLPDANFGRSGPMMGSMKRPPPSRLIMPVAPCPNCSVFLPSLSVTDETSVQVPRRSDVCARTGEDSIATMALGDIPARRLCWLTERAPSEIWKAAMDRLEAMAVLLAGAEAGSLSAASRKLRTPLATVSRKISELAAHLNARLLMRSNRSVVLTDAGRDFVAAARRILQDVTEAERDASGDSRELRGELVLSAPIALGRACLLPVVAQFLADHPSMDVRLMLADRRVNMIEDKIDVSLRV